MTDICHFLCFVLDEYFNGMKRRMTLKSRMKMKMKIKMKSKQKKNHVFVTVLIVSKKKETGDNEDLE
ncbi:hypothetical protein Hanom_Chr13g01212381 [Helianthus anomalus]